MQKHNNVAVDDDAFYASLEEILLTQHEYVIMGDFNLLQIDWSLQRRTPAPAEANFIYCRQ